MMDPRILCLCVGAGLVAGALAAAGVQAQYGLATYKNVAAHGSGGDALTYALTGGGSPALGDPSAPLTMIEWGDYQCTYCYLFHRNTLDAVKQEYVDTGELKIVFQDFPLNGPDSVLAAQASRCAGDQGAYWRYHDTLYENWGGERTGWITAESLRGIALESGLDIGDFDQCVGSGKHLGEVYDAYRYAQGTGIGATPSFVIHDGERTVRITGNQPLSAFVSAIDGFE